LLIVGPKRSGKGTIFYLIRILVGPANCASLRLADFGQHHGSENLVGRSVAFIPDARFGSRDVNAVVESLLSMSGEDYVSVPRKYRSAWQGMPTWRVLIASNELPKLRDASGAVVSRISLIECTRSFINCEDLTLKNKLTAELPAILNRALDGLDRLLRNGAFSTERDAKQSLETMQQLAAPVLAFVKEQCVISGDYEVSSEVIYAKFGSWCNDNGHRRPSKAQFIRDLLAAVPGVRERRAPRDVPGRPRTCYGLRLRTGADHDDDDDDDDDDDAPDRTGAATPPSVG
jgi:putative DNA primase/helicase